MLVKLHHVMGETMVVMLMGIGDNAKACVMVDLLV